MSPEAGNPIALEPPPELAPPSLRAEPVLLTSDPEEQLERGRADAAELESWARHGAMYHGAMLVFGAIALAGLAAFIALAAGGPEPRAKWGYPAAALIFLLSVAQAAPIAALVLRMTYAYWSLPLRRTADLLGLAGLVTAPAYMVLLFQIPDWTGRPSVWFDWPSAPIVPDSFAVALLAASGLSLAIAGAIPDLAAGRWPPLRRLASGWRGSARQWRGLQLFLVIQGSLYTGLYVVVAVLTMSDLAGALIPGWRSGDAPMFLAFSGFEGGLAAVLAAVALLRRPGGLTHFFELDVFDAMSKLLLGFALLYIWFQWSELLVWWYGRTNEEKSLQSLLLYGPYVVPFGLAVLCSWLLPLLLMMWIRLRKTFWAPTVTAAAILAGLYADRIRIFVAAWSIAGPVEPGFSAPPPAHLPGAADALILAGAPCALLFLVLLVLRLVPPVGLWERRQDSLYRVHRPYVRTSVKVVAKPD